jgi:hypothetical protein
MHGCVLGEAIGDEAVSFADILVGRYPGRLPHPYQTESPTQLRQHLLHRPGQRGRQIT